MKPELLTTILVTAVLSAFSAAKLTVLIGAHPWWAVQTGLVGTGVGCLIYGALRGMGLRPGFLGVLSSLGLLAITIEVVLTRQAYIAADGPEALSGRLWYFGWIGLMAALCIWLCSLAAVSLRR